MRAEKRSEGEEEVREARGERGAGEKAKSGREGKKRRAERRSGAGQERKGRMELIMEPAGKEEGVKEDKR